MVPRRRRRRPWYRTRAYRLTRTAVLTVFLVTVGVRCEAHGSPTAPDGADGPDTVLAAGPDGVAAPSARRTPPPRPLPRSRPTSLRIRSLGVDAPVIGVGLDKDRQLETPPVDKAKLVGWYRGGATPGERGTAIAVGHRDTRTGPAVFAALAQIKPGKLIEAQRADGRTAVYTVDRVKVFDKTGFPDKEVYGPVRRPELRVITCGGLFSHRTGYTSNVVVFAHLTAAREPPRTAKREPSRAATHGPSRTTTPEPSPGATDARSLAVPGDRFQAVPDGRPGAATGEPFQAVTGEPFETTATGAPFRAATVEPFQGATGEPSGMPGPH